MPSSHYTYNLTSHLSWVRPGAHSKSINTITIKLKCQALHQSTDLFQALARPLKIENMADFFRILWGNLRLFYMNIYLSPALTCTGGELKLFREKMRICCFYIGNLNVFYLQTNAAKVENFSMCESYLII